VTLRLLPDDVTQRQLPCALCGKPAGWLLWSTWLSAPVLVCEQHGKAAVTIEELQTIQTEVRR
jgi:hypothetical protein